MERRRRRFDAGCDPARPSTSADPVRYPDEFEEPFSYHFASRCLRLDSTQFTCLSQSQNNAGFASKEHNGLTKGPQKFRHPISSVLIKRSTDGSIAEHPGSRSAQAIPRPSFQRHCSHIVENPSYRVLQTSERVTQRHGYSQSQSICLRFGKADQAKPRRLRNNLFALSLLCFLFLLIFDAVDAWTPGDETEDQLGGATTANTTIISQVLNQLTDRSKYDKRLRPRYGEGSVDVGITIHVSSISAVSEVDMDFTLDFYLRQTWHDPRLAFGKLDLRGFESIKSLTVGVDYLDRLWKPDTFFPNEKKSFFHTATNHNSFLRIEPDGRVYTSQRLTVTATCPMELRLFPMDSQACKLEIESYGYTTADISYYWGERRSERAVPEAAVAFEAFMLPQFRRTGFRVNITNAVTLSGKYDRLYIEVILSRNLGFYLMNIIIPSMLIVSISWVSFWLSREASPARVGIGVTTVLTMTTMITTTNNSMPKVSYIKGLDVFLNFCFVMVFASLVEYAVVSYWNKRQCRLRERRRRRGLASPTGAADGPHGSASAPVHPTGPVELPLFTNYPTTPTGELAVSPPPVLAAGASPSHQIQTNKYNNNNYVYRAPGLLIPTGAGGGASPPKFAAENISPAFMNIPPDCDCRAIPLMQYNEAMSLYQPHHQHLLVGFGASGGSSVTLKASRRRGGWRLGGASSGGTAGSANWCCRRFSPSKIDRCSRSMFPLLFIGFNFFYWSIMTFLSRWNTNKQSFVAFHDE